MYEVKILMMWSNARLLMQIKYYQYYNKSNKVETKDKQHDFSRYCILR